jgi:hypothetical protein
VLYDSGDASALSTEAGINLGADTMVDLTAAQREGRGAGGGGQFGVWLSPSGSDESIRLFLCRKACSIAELQQLARRLARPAGTTTNGAAGRQAPGDVPCSGRLVLLPYPELINARDSKTLCAMALYGKPASQPIARSLHRRFIPSQGALPCPGSLSCPPHS